MIYTIWFCVALLSVDAAGTVHRDTYGVPHIFGATDESVLEAYGHTVAHDRLWQLALNRWAARGQLSEFLGERFVELDQYTRSTGYTQAELTAQFATLSAPLQAAFAAYAAGINRYLQEIDNANLWPYEFQALGTHKLAPWQVEDSMAFGVFMLRHFGEIGGKEIDNQQLYQELYQRYGNQAQAIFDDLLWHNDVAAPVTVPLLNLPSVPLKSAPLPHRQPIWPTYLPQLPSAALSLWPRADVLSPMLASLGVVNRLGSYAWVVAPAKSVDGAAMLMGGPQMGFHVPEVVHEVQLQSEQGLHVIGMAFAGFPLVLIGHNEQIAWTSTTAVGDNVDIYVETLCDVDGPGRQNGTYFNQACIPMQTRTETIHVQQSDDVVLEVRRSVHGPAFVTKELPGVAWAQKRAHWQREAQSYEAFWRFNRAANLQEFAAGVAYVVTQHNFLYADREGHIAYWQAGEVPVRAPGFDFRLPLPGDGTAEWTGKLWPMPMSIDPQQGYLASWNNKPTVHFPSSDSRFFGKQWRIREITSRLNKGLISWETMHDIATDIARVEDELGRSSRYLKPWLHKAFAQVPPSDATQAQARQVVATWEGEIFADARLSTHTLPGYSIYKAWETAMLQALYGEILNEQQLLRFVNVNTLIHVFEQGVMGQVWQPLQYDVLKGQNLNVLIAQVFAQVVDELAAAYQTDDINAWVQPREQIVFEHPILGNMFEIPMSNRATFAQILKLQKSGITGVDIFTLGQSGVLHIDANKNVILDAHFNDLLPLYRNFLYKPMELLAQPPIF